jgi:GWxTD domain-containing protein
VKRKMLKTTLIILIFIMIGCSAVNIFAARYYRMLEHERKIFLGLKGLDSLAADEYLNLPSTSARTKFYSAFWQDKTTEEQEIFEERIEYAFRAYGKHSPISDSRIQIYVKYGEPSKRDEIWPQKQLALKTRERVNPAEVWTYRREGLIFDFVRYARAYILIAQSEFGENVKVPHLKEVQQDTFVEVESSSLLDFNVTTGRFRQKKNLTRLEVYITMFINDTTGVSFSRQVKVFNDQDSLVKEKSSILIPADGANGVFVDEVNFWLDPAEYRLEITVNDLNGGAVGKRTIWVNLLDYQDDAKEISDLVPAILIDNTFSNEKFNKPVGRVIPMTDPVLFVHTPFYFYAEVYNLETKNGMHQLKMTYEVTNKAKMKREPVDLMIKDEIEAGNTAYLAAQYHPMDLDPGLYMITLRTVDLLTGKERTAVCEFELKLKE